MYNHANNIEPWCQKLEKLNAVMWDVLHQVTARSSDVDTE